LLDEIVIPAVGRLFAQYCKRPDFDKTARTEYLSPRRGQTQLFLKSPPVSPAVAEVTGPPLIPAIAALRLYQDTATPRAYGASTELTLGTDFFLFEDQGVIESASFFAGGPLTIKATYTGGYLTDDAAGCPDDLRLAAVMQAKILYDRREEISMTGRSLEGGSMSLLTPLSLPKSVTMLLDPYRVFGAD